MNKFINYIAAATLISVIIMFSLISVLMYIEISNEIGSIKKIKHQNTELLKANKYLKAENTYLQKGKDRNKSDKRLLK